MRCHSTSFHVIYLFIFILIISNLMSFLFSYLFVGVLYILWKLAYGLQIFLSVRNLMTLFTMVFAIRILLFYVYKCISFMAWYTVHS